MEHNPDFGYEPDDEGMVNFMTVESDFLIHNFEEYMAFMHQLVRIAEDNPGVMPIYRPGHAKP